MAHSFFRLPMFGFSLLGFLAICVVLAVAVWAAFRSGESGQSKLGGLAGCAIALALLMIAGLGALGCTMIAVIDAPNQWIQRGPVKRIDAHFDESPREFRLHEGDHHEGGEHEDEHAASGTEGDPQDGHLSFRLRIDLAGEDVGEITRWFRDHTDDDLTYTITSEDGPDGPVTHLDVTLPMPRRDLEKLRDDLQREFHLRLPNSVRIEVRSQND